jgi:hypothetical protein
MGSLMWADLCEANFQENTVWAKFGSAPVHRPGPFLERLALSDREIGPNCVLRLAHSVRAWARDRSSCSEDPRLVRNPT